MKKSTCLLWVLLLNSCAGSNYFYQANKNIKPVSMPNATVEKIFLHNAKNRKIAVNQIIPKEKNNISILIIPPNGGNSSVLADLIKPLVENHYTLYLFDYEGYGESEGKADNENVLSDAQMVFDYVVKHKNTEKLLVWGYSLGGNLAVKLVADNQQSIDALIIEGAFTSHRDIAKEKLPRALKWLSAFIKSPYKSKKIISNVHIPVFIAHSENDGVCPFSMGKTLFENANEPKFFLKLTGEHCLGLKNESDYYLKNLENFLRHTCNKVIQVLCSDCVCSLPII